MAQFRDRPGDISNKRRSDERRKANDSSRRAREKQETGKSITGQVLKTIANAVVPGSGLVGADAIEAGVDWLFKQDVGEKAGTPEQQVRAEERRKDSNARSRASTTKANAAVTQEKVDEEVIEPTEPDAPLQDTQKAALVAKAAKKRKKGTETVLTSPLGATETAKTAVFKLGGY